MCAAMWCHAEAAEQLLKANADPAMPNAQGATPLLKACLFGCTDVIRVLLQFGADPDGGQDSVLSPLYKNGYQFKLGS